MAAECVKMLPLPASSQQMSNNLQQVLVLSQKEVLQNEREQEWGTVRAQPQSCVPASRELQLCSGSAVSDYCSAEWGLSCAGDAPCY